MTPKRKPAAGRGLHHRRRRVGRDRRQGPDRARRQGRRPRARTVADARDLRRRRARQHQPLQSLARPAAQSAHRARHRRTRRPRVELFCPVPQMVGGGTVHWQGWLPRFTRERLPPAHGGRRPARHDARRLADHLRRARALLRQGRMGVRRLRPGRRQPLRRRRAAVAIHARRCRCRATREKFHKGCARARLELVPDAAGRPVAPLQRPQADGDQRLRPAARRPDRHALERAQRLHPGRGQDRPLRPAARTAMSAS